MASMPVPPGLSLPGTSPSLRCLSRSSGHTSGRPERQRGSCWRSLRPRPGLPPLRSGARLPETVSEHSGLLTETGVASRCGARKAVPPLSSGTVAYQAFGFTNPSSASSCVTVQVSTKPHSEIFSAAYGRDYAPNDPSANYLGDAGRCTNITGLSGTRIDYSLDLAPGSRFTVEIENCGPGGNVPSYVIEIHNGAAAPVVYRTVTAARTGGVVTLRWRTAKESAGVRFGVYRQQGGVRVDASQKPIRGTGPRGGSYSFADPNAPLIRPLQYWILARSTGGSWSWYGPVTSVG